MAPLPSPGTPRGRFDPWNSSSTGHQRAETRPGPGWREARRGKLHAQFGGPRAADAETGSASRTVVELLRRPGLMREGRVPTRPLPERDERDTPRDAADAPPRPIFAGTSIYVNGSTAPLVSDHRLKHIITRHGGAVALHLGRRTVTHVVLGTADRGRLAAGKTETELRRMRGRGVHFVGVQWVLESLKSGRRLPEARFSSACLASPGQTSVYQRFAPH
ncbi:hypothetical protein E4U53_004200 [Claviceps sorghi]|nr:hypothetical protein E4U53_004200 [Claviceps sorghi]